MPGRRGCPDLCKGEINYNTFLLSQTFQLLKTGCFRKTNENRLTTNNNQQILIAWVWAHFFHSNLILGNLGYIVRQTTPFKINSWRKFDLQDCSTIHRLLAGNLSTFTLVSHVLIVHLSKKWMNIMSRQDIKSGIWRNVGKWVDISLGYFVICIHHYIMIDFICNVNSITAKDFPNVPHLPETVQ